MYNVIQSEQQQIGRFNIILEKIEKNGNIHPFSYVKFKDGVTIIPFISNNEVLLLKEYRHPIKSWEYEFPGGMIDSNESPEEAARREIAEEIGYQCTQLTYLGYMYPSFGSTTEKIHLFAAQLETNQNGTSMEPLEMITTQIVSTTTLENLINENQFTHGSGIVAWMKWKLYNKD